MSSRKNYYETLGVNKNASQEDIKKAYHQLARKWHPDINPTKEAEKKMNEINEAYETLGDPNKKKQYDRERESPFTNFNQGTGQGFTHTSFDDILENFFGDNDNNENTQYEESSQRNGESIRIRLNLTFKESILGAKKKIILERKKACTRCQQSGAFSSADIITCSTCQGGGVINVLKKTIIGTIRTQTTCNNCWGRGRIIKKKCSECLGNKFVRRKETIELNIPRGIRPDKNLRFPGMGNDGLPGGKKGDLIVIIEIGKNSYFRREENDIHVKLPISFLDAILGGTAKIITLEGIENINIPAGLKQKKYEIWEKKGCYTGMNKSSRGNLYIWWEICLPKNITKTTEEILHKLQKDSDWNPNQEFIEKNKNVVDI